MKIISTMFVAALVALSSASFAGEFNTPSNQASPYVSLSTNGDADYTGALGVDVYGFGGLTYNGEVDVTASEGLYEYGATVGASYNYDMFNVGVSGTYSWGDTFVGTGVSGDYTLTPELTVSPQMIGGEYAFVNYNVTATDWSDIAGDGGEVGFGYKYKVRENAYLNTSLAWDYDADGVNNPHATFGITVKF